MFSIIVINCILIFFYLKNCVASIISLCFIGLLLHLIKLEPECLKGVSKLRLKLKRILISLPVSQAGVVGKGLFEIRHWHFKCAWEHSFIDRV